MYWCAGERVESPLRLLLSESENEPGKMMVLANEPLLTGEQRAQNVLPSAPFLKPQRWLLLGTMPAQETWLISPARTLSWSRELLPVAPEGKGRKGLMW